MYQTDALKVGLVRQLKGLILCSLWYILRFFLVKSVKWHSDSNRNICLAVTQIYT